MTGVLYFHQGYSDIISCMPLVNYYSEKYEYLKVLMRLDFKDSFEFYIENIKNIEAIYLPKHQLDVCDFSSMYEILNYSDILFHGYYDFYRKDKFKSVFNAEIFYGKGFYTFYGIDYINKINYFNFERNLNIEENFYNNFISIHQKNYVLYHENIDNKINLDKTTRYCVDINNLSQNIFETIKVLIEAEELHLIDSFWAAFCYLLDARYKIFQNKKIYIYSLIGRCGACLENNFSKILEPVNLNNWIIVNN